MIRRLFLLRYPDGVSLAEGERWYLGGRIREARRMHGLCLYRTWRAQQATVAPPWTTVRRLDKRVRLAEPGFHSWEAWKEGAVDRMPPVDSRPLWAGGHRGGDHLHRRQARIRPAARGVAGALDCARAYRDARKL